MINNADSVQKHNRKEYHRTEVRYVMHIVVEEICVTPTIAPTQETRNSINKSNPNDGIENWVTN